MSNENKKAWIGLIIPVLFVLVMLNYPEIGNSLPGLLTALTIFLILQFNLYKVLNKKFPAREDLKD